ncbi:MAG TPA: M1 family peptidase, partial [Gemmatimonadaceae bacterium]|nr:M1 family peptidase [Gemmatimonadaceae bacterium]
MTARLFALLTPLAILSAASSPSAAQVPERVIRRDIPMTNMIRRAHAAGTRDSTGRPGRNYWQLWTDYKINARLDSATSTVSGRETVTFRNNSDSAMRAIVLRLDQNIFRPGAQNAGGVDLVTDGMKVTRLIVSGQTLDVTDTLGSPIPNSQRRTTPLSRILKGTSARIPLATPIAAHSSGTVEADWSFQVPRVEGPRGFRMGRWADTLYQVAQWYPRLAVFDDLRGWDSEPYLGNAEFYNNFGHFDVSIDVPAGWIVGATGVLQNPTEVLTPTARDRLARVIGSD